MTTYPVPWIGHLIEIASLGLFAWVWVELRKLRPGEHQELLVALAYGWLLETLDMRVFGSYHYGPLTWLWLGHVPVYIPLLWACIIHSSMELSERSRLPDWALPWMDGLLAVLIDLAIDAIAIRLGLWHWGIPLDQGWFGVPAGNLCAWMWVAFWYGAMTRLVRRRIRARGEPVWHRWLVPAAAYAGLLSSILAVGSAGTVLGFVDPNERLWLFAAQVAVFFAVVAWAARGRPAQRPRPRMPSSLIWNRWLMHGSFFTLWLTVPQIRACGGLGGLATFTLVLEWLACRWCESGTVKKHGPTMTRTGGAA